MRRAAELKISGPGASDTLAASGGLEVPGREAHPPDPPARAEEAELIPGEHDHATEPQTQPAIVGTTGFGGDLPVVDIDTTLDEDARRRYRWEGGGRQQ